MNVVIRVFMLLFSKIVEREFFIVVHDGLDGAILQNHFDFD